MAIAAIDATSGGASANSYGLEAEATAYFEIRPGGNLWVDLGAEQKRGALQFAAILIDRETFWGQKNDATQALKFPRTNQSDVPLKVKHAQFEQALHLVDGGYLKQLDFIEAQSSGIREVSAGDTRTRMIPSHSDSFASFQLAPPARQLLSGFVEGGARVGRA